MKTNQTDSVVRSPRNATGALALLLLALVLAPASPASAQLTPEWIVRQHATTSFAFVGLQFDVATDDQGGIYVVGTTGTINISDMLTIKYAPDGTQVWASQHAGLPTGRELGQAIAVDHAGNIIVIGTAGGNFTVVKYNPADGTEIWANSHDGGGGDRPNAVTTDDAGNIYVTGQSWVGGDEWDYYTIKLDSAGNVLWSARYNNPGGGLFQYDIASAIGVDSNGDVFVTGTSNRVFSATQEFATIKYRGSDGAQLWLSRYGTNGSNTIATALVISPDDDVYVTGGSFQNAHFYTTIRYNGQDGSERWVSLQDPAGRDRATAMKLDSRGDVYLTGWSDPDNDESNFNEDIVTMKLRASDGRRVWMTRFGNPAVGFFDLGHDLVIDAADNVYVAGENTGVSILFRYDPATGAELGRHTQRGGASERTAGLAVALDPSQNVIVAARARNANTENRDLLTIKYTGVCFADCDGNGALDVFDFLCFQNSFVAGQPYACDCNPDPACDIFDFLCFQSAFVAGCP